MAGVKNRRSVDGRPNRLVERLEAGQVITAVDQEAELQGIRRQGIDNSKGRGNCSKLYTIILAAPDSGETSEEHIETANIPQTSKNSENEIEQSFIVIQKSLGGGGQGLVNAADIFSQGGKKEERICLKQSILDEGKDTAKALEREYVNFKCLCASTRNGTLGADGDHVNTGHPNIIKFLFFCAEEIGPQVFIGLEFFDGDDISGCIRTIQESEGEDCFTFGQQINIIGGVMAAVQYLERHGLIHCDIKPQNVMFNVHRGDVKLIDFGSAVKVNEEGMSETKEKLVGTVEYSAPEVIAENQDCQLLKADVYSVGALMFKVILFERPWKSKLNTARNMPCGGHREARQILQGVFEEYENQCLEKCDQLPTPLQEQVTDQTQNYFKDSPDLCQLVYKMLFYTPHSRPDIGDIIDSVEKMNCPLRKHTSRMSSASSRCSRENSSMDVSGPHSYLFTAGSHPTPSNPELLAKHSDYQNPVPVEEESNDQNLDVDRGPNEDMENGYPQVEFHVGDDEESEAGGAEDDGSAKVLLWTT